MGWEKYACFTTRIRLDKEHIIPPVHFVVVCLVKSFRNLKTLFLDLSLVLISVQVQNVTAKYIMKCDDDTFVRVDSVLEEVQATSIGEGLYLGSMNEFHRPLRTGKWAVTFEVFSVETHLVCVSLILLILWLR